jgi:hypothetical protein
VSHDLRVERIAGDSDAGVAHDIGRGPPATADCGTDANQGKVAGAPSEVSNQDQLVAWQRGLVVVGRRHRCPFQTESP